MSADHAAAVLAAGVLCALAFQTSDSLVARPGDPGFVMVHGWAYGRLLDGITWVVGHGAWAAKAASVFAGIGAVVAVTRMLGPWAGLWLIAQPVMLHAGITLGPAMPALCLGLCGFCVAMRGLGGWAGIFVGLAVLLDPSAWPLAVVCWFALRPGIRFIGLLCATTFPLWAQGLGPDMVMPSDVGGVQIWWDALLDRGRSMMGDIPLVLGALALLWGVKRKNRASRLLMLWVIALLLAPLVMPSVDIGLPLAAAVVLGVAAVETGPALLLGSLVVMGFSLAQW